MTAVTTEHVTDDTADETYNYFECGRDFCPQCGDCMECYDCTWDYCITFDAGTYEKPAYGE